MDQDAVLPVEDLKRLPGLYRRWELTEVFEPNRNYHIEDAGLHADGTPLLAIYVSDPPQDADSGTQVAGEAGEGQKLRILGKTAT